ncbi:MAG TPA: thioredoxin, partial [Burkholderiales bacterium]|nr:thioredoxin [Burkholderiales bacterium]
MAAVTGKRWRALHGACAPILAFWAFAAATAGPLPFARDLAADGRAARESGRVIVVLYSTVECPYCKKVREDFL